MRRGRNVASSAYKIMVVDDEIGVIDSLSVVLGRFGHFIRGTVDPLDAVQQLRDEHFDILVLDYLMTPIHGDKVVELIREFDKDIYILLLTGYKDFVPPIKTIRSLDIQGYCEKSDSFDQLILMVESGIKCVAQRVTISKFKGALSRILESVPSIYRLQAIDKMAETILDEATLLIDSDDTFIHIADLGDNGRLIYRGAGVYNTGHYAVTETTDPQLHTQISAALASGRSRAAGNKLVVPLISAGREAFGVFFARAENLSENREFIEIFTNQAAASLSNAFMHSMVNSRSIELGRTNKLLEQHYMELIGVLRVLVDAKDEYTRGHSDRVSLFSMRIGESLKLSEDEIETLRVGGLFHDIGKISTPDHILLKKGNLDDKEFEEIKRHPVKGADMLSKVSVLRDIIPIIKYHHEWVNGTGYPSGLAKDKIPLLARIVAVADAYDAMMSDRAYRPRLTSQEAIDRLIEGVGSQFDANVVETVTGLASVFSDISAEIEKEMETENRDIL